MHPCALMHPGQRHLGDQVNEHLASDRLVRLLQAWCPMFPGFYLYYPGHRQTPPALAALVEALRYRPV